MAIHTCAMAPSCKFIGPLSIDCKRCIVIVSYSSLCLLAIRSIYIYPTMCERKRMGDCL